jgi:hypothetical protein
MRMQSDDRRGRFVVFPMKVLTALNESPNYQAARMHGDHGSGGHRGGNANRIPSSDTPSQRPGKASDHTGAIT